MSKRTDTIRSLFTQPQAAPPALETKSQLSADNRPPEPQRRSAGAVSSIRDTFSEIERENEALRQAAASGDRVIEVDPELIDPSPFPDRFADDDERSFALLKASIEERGQEVPVLLRPHPTAAGRYQTAFGHRRVRALRALGRKVRAIVRPLDDDALAAAQGVENSARADLSFIERAFFALRLEEAGRGRLIVQQALSIDKAEASKLVAVARAIPEPIVAAIGRAPRAGRPRWQALAEALRNDSGRARVVELAKDSAFRAMDSDARFAAALALARRSPIVAAMHKPVRNVIRSADGRNLAEIVDGDDATRITIDRKELAGFADFVGSELPALFERFKQSEADL